MQASRGSIISGLAILVAVILFGLLVTCVAIAGDEEDGLGVQQVASHEYCDEQSDCYGGEYEQDYSSNDRNRNRNRERGAFSPGPFDDSPVDAFNNVCMPGATCYYDPPRQEEQRNER